MRYRLNATLITLLSLAVLAFGSRVAGAAFAAPAAGSPESAKSMQMEEPPPDAHPQHSGMTQHDASESAENGTMDMNGAASGHDHNAMSEDKAAPGHVHPAPTEQATVQAAGVDEKLGQQVADATLYDSEGHAVRLSELLTVPTIILPVYYTCPDVCFLLQSAFAKVLPQVALEPGKEIQVLSISFDDRDTPQAAAKSKRNYMKALKGEFPPQYWKFLTGSQEEVGRVMDSIGFRYQRVGDAFAHPVVVVAVSPGGKIVRYLYGMDFLPFDITMAATEAAEGKVGMSVKRMLSFCFNYDPEGRRYVFDLMRVSGVAILGFAFVFLMFLLLSGRRKKRGDR